ncbi:MAG: FAD synthetase family protein [Bacteroidales bacterium]|nr:FAD synthetase family protein [Bacteroidales bacterium]
MAISVGSFDGVHLAHHQILQKLAQEAENIGGQSLVVTFSTHPRAVIDPDYQLKLLNTIEEKNQLIARFHIDNILYLNFDKQTANLSYQDFYFFLLKHINIQSIVMGFNHSFGKNKEGNFNSLTALNQNKIHIINVEQQKIHNENISSTIIRRHLQNGDIALANKLLGYSYSIAIKKIENQENKTLFSIVDHKKVLPQNGTYHVLIDQMPCEAVIKDTEIIIDKKFDKDLYSLILIS